MKINKGTKVFYLFIIYQLLMWFWPVNEKTELVSGMPAPQSGYESTRVRESGMIQAVFACCRLNTPAIYCVGTDSVQLYAWLKCDLHPDRQCKSLEKRTRSRESRRVLNATQRGCRICLFRSRYILRCDCVGGATWDMSLPHPLLLPPLSSMEQILRTHRMPKCCIQEFRARCRFTADIQMRLEK
jgi:hypothetical protein